MDGLTKVERLQETLSEYAIRDVPDDFDPWPAIQERMVQITSPMRTVPRTSKRIAIRAIPIFAGTRPQHLGLRFNLPMILVVILGAATLGIAVLASMKMAAPNAGGGSDFVPAGKVRHIVISTKQEKDESTNEVWAPMTGTIDVWFANGPGNLRQRTTYRQYGSAISTPQTSDVWVQDSMMYTSIPDQKIVLWQSWPFASMYAPDPNIISSMLQQPSARIISDTVLDGRNVVVIEVVSPEDDLQVWIDKDTHRAFQWRNASMERGLHTGISTEKIVVDELVDASTLAPDFFDFKLLEGYTLVERLIPTSVPTKSTLVVPVATAIP